MLPKIDNLRGLCSLYFPDIICVVETWLHKDILDSEISIQGFSIVRLDRASHGGGVIIYFKSLFICSPLSISTAEIECIALSLKCSGHSQNSPDFTIVLFYRPPNTPDSLLDSLFAVLCNLNVSLFSNFFIIR